MENIPTIELCINDEKDLYNKFTILGKDKPDASNAKINNDIIDYLMAETEKAPVHSSLVIAIKLQKEIVVGIDNIEKLIKESVIERISLINKTLRRFRIFAIISALIGMFLIGTTQFTHIIERRYSLNEFVIVMSWVFMWKAVELMFFDKMKYGRDKGLLLKIYISKIVKL